jgi:hypothetical protein
MAKKQGCRFGYQHSDKPTRANQMVFSIQRYGNRAYKARIVFISFTTDAIFYWCREIAIRAFCSGDPIRRLTLNWTEHCIECCVESCSCICDSLEKQRKTLSNLWAEMRLLGEWIGTEERSAPLTSVTSWMIKWCSPPKAGRLLLKGCSRTKKDLRDIFWVTKNPLPNRRSYPQAHAVWVYGMVIRSGGEMTLLRGIPIAMRWTGWRLTRPRGDIQWFSYQGRSLPLSGHCRPGGRDGVCFSYGDHKKNGRRISSGLR